MTQTKNIYTTLLLLFFSLAGYAQVAENTIPDAKITEIKKAEMKVDSAKVDSSTVYDYFDEDDDWAMYFLREFVFVVNKRDSKSLQEQSIAFSSMGSSQIEMRGIKTMSDLSGSAPNFFIADQGASLATTMTMRGFSSVIDPPLIGMNIDNVPCLNKNTFDADLFDVERIEVLRGPQGTQSGRNSMLGVLNVYSFSPLTYQGSRFKAEYSSGNTIKVKASTYQKPNDSLGVSIAANYKHAKGFFENTHTGNFCDKLNTVNARARIVYEPKTKFSVDNVLTFGFLAQNGFPYAQSDINDVQDPISYNFDTEYKRVNISDGLVIQYKYEKFIFSSITGYQFLHDDLTVDPDFTDQPLAIRQEKQNEHAISHEFAFRSTTDTHKFWNWKNGWWLYYKHNKQDAPYTYEREGIDQLFTAGINNAIQKNYPDGAIQIKQDQVTISNELTIPTFGTAFYHQSEFTVKKWDFALGLRLNLERVGIDYLNKGDFEYLFNDGSSSYKEISSYLYGDTKKVDFKVLPKISAQYNFNQFVNLYGYVSRGQKGGGYNTQIFTDYIQNKLMRGVADEMGISVKGTPLSHDFEKDLSFEAEHSWNYEIGGHMMTEEKDFNVDFAFFYIDCRNQQVTLFPDPQRTSSMTVNANKSRSFGGELAINWEKHIEDSTSVIKGVFTLEASYGYTHATFVDFVHNGVDYAGKRTPFAPSNTIGIECQYKFRLRGDLIDYIIVGMDWKGFGKIYWDEANRYSQPFYSITGAAVSLQRRAFEIKGWIKNLFNTEYSTYAFTTLGNHFSQRGTPREIGVSLSYKLKNKDRSKEE